MIIRVSTPADHIKVPCLPLHPPSPVPAALAKLGPLHPNDTGRLRAHLRRVPDPRSRRGRWYPLAGLLLICACAVVSGARTITEITEWGQRATTTVLEHLGIRRRSGVPGLLHLGKGEYRLAPRLSGCGAQQRGTLRAGEATAFP